MSDAERVSASMPLCSNGSTNRVGDLESEVLSTTESEDVLNKIRSEAAAEAAAVRKRREN